eukprot:1196191-Prorocentrum_minimum.AAC.9
MSKSLGNVVDPRLVIDGGKDKKAAPAYGADVLRLWVASVDYTTDVCIGDNIIKQTFEAYRKVRGTVRYLLGNLSDYDPAEDAVPYAELPAVDRYTLAKLAALEKEAAAAYDSFQFYRVFQKVADWPELLLAGRVRQALTSFNSQFLSTFYLDMAKDRLYIRDKSSFARRSCQTTLDAILTTLVRPRLVRHENVPALTPSDWYAVRIYTTRRLSSLHEGTYVFASHAPRGHDFVPRGHAFAPCGHEFTPLRAREFTPLRAREFPPLRAHQFTPLRAREFTSEALRPSTGAAGGLTPLTNQIR